MRLACAAVLGAVCAGVAGAQETTTYTYDALERLTNVVVVGGPTSGTTGSVSYDAAGNRLAQSLIVGTGVTFDVADAAATEGGTLSVNVTKSGTASGSVTVQYATSNGTAVSGSDYTAQSGTLTFLTTETVKTVSVPTVNDANVEPVESFSLLLSAPGGATIIDGSAALTILDNDEAPPAFSIANAAAVTEGSSLSYIVTKSGTVSNSYSVNYASANGSATAGSDYTAGSGTLTFLAADTSKTVTVATTNDTTIESAETVLVNLTGPTGGATIGTAQASGTINDNDTANQSPVANADSLSVAVCSSATKNVIANDTDPDGDLPLTLLSVSGGSRGLAQVISSTSIQYDSYDVSGADSLSYVVRDSRGATSTGTVGVTVQSGVCN